MLADNKQDVVLCVDLFKITGLISSHEQMKIPASSLSPNSPLSVSS